MKITRVTNGSGFTNIARWSSCRVSLLTLSDSTGLRLNASHRCDPESMAVIFVSSPPWL